jgi:hypothetical protein
MSHTNIAISNRKKLIVVLGMHRSGTSAITRGLICLGVQLGNRLIPPIEGNNDKGFWEDIDLNNLNNEILETIYKEWHYFVSIQQEEIEFLRQKGYFERAVEMMRQKVAGSTIYGIKDPRFSILLPFWKEVFSFLEYEVHYIIAVRHPMSVVKSLLKRDGFDYDKSYFLWQSHVINSLSGTIGCSRIVVDYDKLIQYPEKELKRIANAFNLEIDSRELEIYTIEFLDNNLRHSIHKADDLLFDKASALVRNVYGITMELSTTLQIDEDSLTQNIEKWEKEILYLTPLLTIADKLTWQISTINAALDQREIALNLMNEELYIISEELNQKNLELNQKNLELNHKNLELNHKNLELNQKNLEFNQKNEELNHKNEELNQKNEELIQKNEELGQKQEEINQKNIDIIQIIHSKSWRITKPLRFLFSFLRSLLLK